MLSYQHAYHIGAPADCLKHALLCSAINYAHFKPGPLHLWDVHAGRGFYPVAADETRKLNEYQSGVGRLWPWPKDAPPALAPWRKVLAACNEERILGTIPGSSGCLLLLARPQDEIHLTEKHPGEFAHLKTNISERSGDPSKLAAPRSAGGHPSPAQRSLGGVGSVHHLPSEAMAELGPYIIPPSSALKTTHTDGYPYLIRHLNPNARNIVLIDPSYETAEDFINVFNAVESIRANQPKAQVHVWYPILSDGRENDMVNKLLAIKWPGTYHIRAMFDNPPLAYIGTGHLIFGTPFNLFENTQEIGTYLAKKLHLKLEKNGLAQRHR